MEVRNLSFMRATIGRLTSVSKKYKSKFPEDAVTSIGGAYYKILDVGQKVRYAKLTQFVHKPDINSDHHLGDANFQSTVIGNLDQFLTTTRKTMSTYYHEFDEDKKVFDFPNKIKQMINTSKSAYNPHVLVDSTISYLERVKNRIKGIEPHPRVIKLVDKYWTSIWAGIQVIKEEPIDVQQELILTGLAPNTNSGYPYWIKQTKKNFPRVFKDFLKQFFPVVLKRHRKTIDEGYSLTVDIILDAVKEAINLKYYPPFTLFYRTQGGKNFETKHRSVFGGDILMKALGSLWSVAKGDDKAKIMADGMPWIAWTNWTDLFTIIKDRIPVEEEYSSDQLKEMWPSANIPDGMHQVEVYGEDFSGYDQTIIREDLEWITKHKHVGWIMRWILDTLSEAEVWFLGLRIKGIFFKSGHPFTSEFGSIIHRTFMENAADRMNGICLGGTVLSDDNLGWYLNFNEHEYLSYAKEVGMQIDKDRSFRFSRDKVVSFLKVLVGYATSSSAVSYIGDPQSRYYGLAHSEREMVGQFDDKEMKGDLRHIYRVTGDIQIDAFISKLGSFAETGAALVEQILGAVKDTLLGRKVIQAIIEMSIDGEYLPYRIDLFTSFSPTWLAKLDVQKFLSDQ